MAALYWASGERKRLLTLAAGIFVVIALTAHMQVRLNAWNQPFYDALTRKSVPDFVRQLGVFAVLAAILLALNVTQVWLNQTTKLTLRRSLVHDLFGQWLKPARAYIPPGTLRAALAYPRAPGNYEDAAIHRALADVGLEHFRPLLDTTDRWDRRLDENEKQALAFARVLLQRPGLVVVNGAFDALDPASRQRIAALFVGPFSSVSLVGIGQDWAPETFFTRKLHLVTDPNGPTFSPAAQGASASA
jgi:ABC-type uncharacterized transport system fused permease/ATPase subunit